MDLLRRNRDFRVVFIAQVVSYLGDWFATVALLGLVVEDTHSDAAASLVFVAQMLPAFLAAPLAGTAADRFNRRTLMIAVSSAQAVAALFFLLAGRGHVWVAFAAQVGVSSLAAFFAPASQAALPNLVDAEDLGTATSMMASTWGAMLAIGAAIGGAFTVAFGRQASFVADAASFAIAGTLIATVRRPMNEPVHAPGAGYDSVVEPLGVGAEIPEPAPAGPRSGAVRMRPIAGSVDALRFARSRPDVMALLGSKMGFGLVGGVVGLLAAIAAGRFGTHDAGIGLLLAARGAGAFIGPVVAMRLVRARGTPGVVLGCGVAAIVFAAGYALVPLAPTLLLVAACVFVAHTGGGAQWTMSTFGLQQATPDALRGRIFAADYALVTLTMSVSFLFTGVASDRWGPGPVVATVAVLALIWGVTYLVLTRGVRRRPPVLAAARAPAT